MPGPVLPDQKSSLSQIVPSWLQPENASVFDPPWRSAMREAVRLVTKLTGLDDPQTAILATANPAELANSEASFAMQQVEKHLPRLAKALKAFHGSPHDFPPEPGAPLGRFREDKIGTGEGVQAFAHGHYSADAEPTAKVYRDSLVEPHIGGVPAETVRKAEPQSIYDVLRGMKATNPDTTIEQAAAVWDTIKARARVVDNVVSYGKAARGMMQHDPAAVALYDKMLETGELVFPKGHMYELAIHADPEHFLDWDKPLSEQSEHVQQAVKSLFAEGTTSAGTRGYWSVGGEQFLGENPTGEKIYNALVEDAPTAYHDKAPKFVSEDLRQAGIPGVRYRDASSRGLVEFSPAQVASMETELAAARKTLASAGPYDPLPPGLANRAIELEQNLASAKTPITRNTVVFPGNEYLIEILKKYGLFLPAGAGALYEAQKTGQQAAGE